MINFSTLKGLTIPEGNVKQISDAQGNVLWSAGPKIVTLTVTTQKAGAANANEVYIQFPYNGGTTTIDAGNGKQTFQVPTGTVIYCKTNLYGSDCGVFVNGVRVGDESYNYTVSCETRIMLNANLTNGNYGDTYGSVKIIEKPIICYLTFTMMGMTVEAIAREGMTWKDFVNEGNNAFTIVDGIVNANGMGTLYYNGNAVKGTDLMIPNGQYTT